MDIKIRQKLDIIESMLGINLTEEQRELASDFTKPVECLANPGTGKTTSIIVGIILAQTLHGVAGQKINAMSYTRESTAELKSRYDKACKKMYMVPTVQFNTFHSICYRIVREVYPNMKVRGYIDYEADLPVLLKYMQQREIECEDYFYVKRVLECINKCNSSMNYADDHVLTSFEFKKLNMDVSDFQELRMNWFMYGLLRKEIMQGDIPVYALFCLLKDPTLQAKYKKKFEIMVVDEFQDMSLLNLWILQLISSNLIVVGDIKQQIYLFNGACSTIVDKYREIFPDAKHVELTQSFRCGSKIAEYSTAVVKNNFPEIEVFKSAFDGGSVNFIPSKDLDIKSIASMLKKEQDELGISEMRDVMFLFRNNYSATPVAEALYKEGVLCRVNKFAKVMDIPIYKDLCKMAELCLNPRSEENLAYVTTLFPEFRKYRNKDCPLIEHINKSRRDLFTVRYEFKEESSIKIIDTLKRARMLLMKDSTADVVFGVLFPIYENYLIEGKWWKLDNKPEYYTSLVSPITTTKTYEEMVSEEYDKANRIQDAVNVNMGVRCYTTHTSKGLEAQDIYLLDAEADVFPNIKKLNEYIKSDCALTASLELRNERNLLYVALSRAKENVYVTYTDKPTDLLVSPKTNQFDCLDEVYRTSSEKYDDIERFKTLFNIKE